MGQFNLSNAYLVSGALALYLKNRYGGGGVDMIHMAAIFGFKRLNEKGMRWSRHGR